MSQSLLEQGKVFLAENAKKEGVITTPSGLQYKIIKEGAGRCPTLKNSVVVHYRGTSISGVEFDSSYRSDEPVEFPLSRVIKGWKEGVLLMREGAHYQFFIPAKLAYGKRGSGIEIAPDEVLIFEVELIKVWDD